MERDNKCFWCGEYLTDNELLFDENGEAHCPKCGLSGILSNQIPPEKQA
jgi:hypothetical protein